MSGTPTGSGTDAGAVLEDLGEDELVEERDFLLASLTDLDAELAAGDIDQHDYITLKDGYTARAAAVLRALDARRGVVPAGAEAEAAAPEPVASDAAPADGARTRTVRPVGEGRGRKRARSRWRGPAWVAVIVLFAVVAGLLVAHSSGQRLPGQTVTGSITPTGPQAELVQAGTDFSNGDYVGALRIYDKVIKDDPSNAEALANRGWVLVLTGHAANDQSLVTRGYTSIQAAEKANPSYPYAHFYAGLVLLCDKTDAPSAAAEFRQALADNP
ncbi:MAG TPA: hypothetical protein VNY84_04050, partial [Acidimicrobiales bacterium]|nr:hypothetical protein [Acidimicrobiales bacterium]